MEPPQAHDQSAEEGHTSTEPKVFIGSKSERGLPRRESGAFEFLPAPAQFRAAGGSHGENPAAILPLLNHAVRGTASWLLEFESADEEISKEIGREGDPEVVQSLVRPASVLGSKAVRSGSPLWRRVSESGKTFFLIAVPFAMPGGRFQLLCSAVPGGNRVKGDEIAAVIQGHGWWLTQATISGERRREGEALQRVAAFQELVGVCSVSDDYEQAVSQMVDHLEAVVGCAGVAILDFKRSRPRLVSASGGVEVKRGTEVSTALEEIADGFGMTPGESVQNPGLGSGEDSSPLAALSNLFGATGWVARTLELEGRSIGCWIYWWDQSDPHFEEKERFIRASSPLAAGLVSWLRESKPSGIRAFWLRTRRLATNAQKTAILMGLGLVAGGALFPVERRIAADCRVEPVAQRIVAAPFAATLRKSHVEAGDIVMKGELLADLDGREIRFQLAELMANRVRAEREADNALDQGKIAEARMASLEAEGFRQQEALMKKRQEQLEITAPIDGMVLSGDLERVEAAPVQTGDGLFEIAPIDNMLIEIEIAEGDVSLTEEGMEVVARFAAYPGEIFESSLVRIAPRSEMRGGRNVFVGEAPYANSENRLRPGMRGKVDVKGGREPLAWSLLRPAVNYVRFRLGW